MNPFDLHAPELDDRRFQDIVDEVVAMDAHLLACACSLLDKVPLVERLIELVRHVRPELPVVVGGRVFNVTEDLWRVVGADGWGADARAAVETASRAVPPPTRRAD